MNEKINYNDYNKYVKTRVFFTDYDHLDQFVDRADIQPYYDDNLLLTTDHVPGEIWTKIPGYSPCYISNYSRVKLDIGNKIFRLLQQNPVFIDDNMYMQVFLSDGIKQTRCRVDRIMYAAFIDPEFPIYQWNPEHEIIHKDGNTLNCDRENLLKIKVN